MSSDLDTLLEDAFQECAENDKILDDAMVQVMFEKGDASPAWNFNEKISACSNCRMLQIRHRCSLCTERVRRNWQHLRQQS
jgi:hypothetical protein